MESEADRCHLGEEGPEHSAFDHSFSLNPESALLGEQLVEDALDYYDDPAEDVDPFQLSPSDIEILAEYSIHEVIGEGAFSIVRKVIHSASGVEYALKILDKSLSNACDKSQLQREILLIQSVEHPNLVCIFI